MNGRHDRAKLLGHRPNAGPMLVIGGGREHHLTSVPDHYMERLRLEGAFVCRCAQPEYDELGGAWGLLGARQCIHCGKPPQESLSA